MVLFQVVLLVTWGFPRRISWDHRVRLVYVGRNLKAHLVPTPCHGQETRLDQPAGQGSVGMGQLCELDHSQIPADWVLHWEYLRFGADFKWRCATLGTGLSQIFALTEPGGCFELGDERMVWATWVRVMGFAPWLLPRIAVQGRQNRFIPLSFPISWIP